jgi:hypothetical protein
MESVGKTNLNEYLTTGHGSPVRDADHDQWNPRNPNLKQAGAPWLKKNPIKRREWLVDYWNRSDGSNEKRQTGDRKMNCCFKAQIETCVPKKLSLPLSPACQEKFGSKIIGKSHPPPPRLPSLSLETRVDFFNITTGTTDLSIPGHHFHPIWMKWKKRGVHGNPTQWAHDVTEGPDWLNFQPSLKQWKATFHGPLHHGVNSFN